MDSVEIKSTIQGQWLYLMDDEPKKIEANIPYTHCNWLYAKCYTYIASF